MPGMRLKKDSQGKDLITIMSEKERVSVICKGNVQGIGFRYIIRKEAIKFNLKGYVMNLRDGSVEIIAEGSKDNIRGLVLFIRSDPGSSRIEEIDIKRSSPLGEFTAFSIKYD